MNLQPRQETITVQKEFLYSTQMLSFKVGGITLDNSAFTDGEYVKAGTIVTINSEVTAGAGVRPLAVPYDSAFTTVGTPYVVAHDTKIEAGVDPVVGAVEEGYLNRNKVTGSVTDLESNSNYRFKLRG